MVSLLKSLIVRIWFLFSFLHLNSPSLHCPALFCPEQVGRPLNNSVWALARGTKESRTNREEDLPAGRSASAAARIVLWGRSSVLALQRRTRQEEEVGCQRSGHAGLSASTAAHTQRFQSILTPHSPQSPSSEWVCLYDLQYFIVIYHYQLCTIQYPVHYMQYNILMISFCFSHNVFGEL